MGLASFIQSLPEAGGERETQRSPPPPPRGRRTVTGAKVERFTDSRDTRVSCSMSIEGWNCKFESVSALCL